MKDQRLINRIHIASGYPYDFKTVRLYYSSHGGSVMWYLGDAYVNSSEKWAFAPQDVALDSNWSWGAGEWDSLPKLVDYMEDHFPYWEPNNKKPSYVNLNIGDTVHHEYFSPPTANDKPVLSVTAFYGEVGSTAAEATKYYFERKHLGDSWTLIKIFD